MQQQGLLGQTDVWASGLCIDFGGVRLSLRLTAGAICLLVVNTTRQTAAGGHRGHAESLKSFPGQVEEQVSSVGGSGLIDIGSLSFTEPRAGVGIT